MVRTYLGVDLTEGSSVHGPESASIGQYTVIHGAVYMEEGAQIGVGCVIKGGGEVHLCRYATVGAHCVLLTATNIPTGAMNDVASKAGVYTNVLGGRILLCEHAVVNAKCVVMPGVTVPEGCVIGAGSYVDGPLKQWTIYHPKVEWVEKPRERFVWA